MSDNYIVKNDYCEGVKTLKDNNGLYVVTYLGCEYNEKVGVPSPSRISTTSSYILYTYQELEKEDVTYYRYRTVEKVTEDDIYTDNIKRKIYQKVMLR